MDQAYCILKTNGKIYRIPKAPFETNEQVMDRCWYISKQSTVNLSESLQWSYRKYLKVKY